MYQISRRLIPEDYRTWSLILQTTPCHIAEDHNVDTTDRSRVPFPMWSLDFLIDLIQLHYGPEVDSASNRNEYQESPWG
jgi:hypothetical protein